MSASRHSNASVSTQNGTSALAEAAPASSVAVTAIVYLPGASPVVATASTPPVRWNASAAATPSWRSSTAMPASRIADPVLLRSSAKLVDDPSCAATVTRGLVQSSTRAAEFSTPPSYARYGFAGSRIQSTLPSVWVTTSL